MTSYDPGLLIVADDLSGAADSAVAFADRTDVAVLLDATEPRPTTAVLAVDTDSRYLPGPAAAARVHEALAAAGPETRVYKKIDSTLRGNIGPEVRACLDALRARRHGPCLAVLAPAFPATGRTVRDGQVLVADGTLGQPRPVDRPSLTEQLTAVGLTVELLDLDTLRGGRAAARLAIAAGRSDAVVVDALTDDDLADVLAACADLPVLLVGSGGLAHRLAAPGRVGGDATATPVSARRPADPAGPLLICVGSRSEQARAQCRAVVERLPAVGVALPAGQDGRRAAAQEVRAALRAGHDTVLCHDPELPVTPARAQEFAAALAAAARDALPLAGGLVATGGETARAVLRTVGVTHLTVEGEPAPGVVRMRTPAGLPVVTKAGAFGDEGTLLRAAHALPGHTGAPRRPALSPTAGAPHVAAGAAGPRTEPSPTGPPCP